MGGEAGAEASASLDFSSASSCFGGSSSKSSGGGESSLRGVEAAVGAFCAGGGEGAGEREDERSLVGDAEFPSAGLAGDEGADSGRGSAGSVGVTGPLAPEGCFWWTWGYSSWPKSSSRAGQEIGFAGKIRSLFWVVVSRGDG